MGIEGLEPSTDLRHSHSLGLPTQQSMTLHWKHGALPLLLPKIKKLNNLNREILMVYFFVIYNVGIT